MLGSPYELTRSDMDNPKGITLLDLETGEERFFKNDFSPKFKRFQFEDLLEKNIDEANSEFENNFVDIMIDPRMALKAPLNILTDSIKNPRKISFHPYDPNQATSLEERMRSTDDKQFDVIDFIEEYVDQMDHDKETKTKIISTINKLHSIIISQDQENKI